MNGGLELGKTTPDGNERLERWASPGPSLSWSVGYIVAIDYEGPIF